MVWVIVEGVWSGSKWRVCGLGHNGGCVVWVIVEGVWSGS